jgi:COP9 signalosome complex subunit 2
MLYTKKGKLGFVRKTAKNDVRTKTHLRSARRRRVCLVPRRSHSHRPTSCNMSDDEMEDYGFEYSDDEDDGDDEEADIENQYYNSKALVEAGNHAGALAGFAQVVSMEPEQGEWGFKSLKQIVKLHFSSGAREEMMRSYRTLLSYVKSSVTKNKSEKTINSILNCVGASDDATLLREFYQTTLLTLKEAKNDRLWFKTNLKLCKMFFEQKDFTRVSRISAELYAFCQTEHGGVDQKKGTQLLEVYAIEIQVFTETKNNKKLKQLYHKALAVTSAIPHPYILGTIRECGGKMHMADRNFPQAASDFFESFKNYDEAGQPRRVQSLKYMVLANMLMQSDVNPFDAQEARPFRTDPEVVAMTSLVSAYQKNDVTQFELLLKKHESAIMADPFVAEYVNDLLKNIRTQVLIAVIKPYTRVKISFIATELKIDKKDVQDLLVSLILNGKILAKIDQVKDVLETTTTSPSDANAEGAPKDVYQGLEGWANAIQTQLGNHFMQI